MTSSLNWGRIWCLALLLAVVGILLDPQPSPAQADPKTTCDSVPGQLRKFCHDKKQETERCKDFHGPAKLDCESQGESSQKDSSGPCSLLKGVARKLCENRTKDIPGLSSGGRDGGESGLTNGASQHVKDLANWLIDKIKSLVAPKDAWAPEKADNAAFAPFLWLGQHLAVAIFVCVIVVCGLSAWQGTPRLKQMGHSTGWTLVAVAGMASVPGIVMLLNKAVSEAFTAAFNTDESSLFGAITQDLKNGADSGNPLAILIIVSALCVALGFAALVFMTRQPGILAFVCISPLVIASLARGGDTEAVQRWAQRLLGLMFAPMALLLVAPFVKLVQGSLVMDAVLLVAADAVMLRMIFHGVPYIGPRLAGAARSMVESRTTNPLARAAIRASVPDFHEQENSPRGPLLVPTPGRAMAQDGDVLFASYGGRPRPRPGRLTTESAMAQINNDGQRSQRLMAARRQARAANQPPADSRPTPNGRTPAPAPAPRPARGPRSSPPGPRSSGPNTP
ncbi:hypothetical protein ACFVFQ_37440 [Streptomyces sp. NPDC057743]|uniref:hypothetical protein n=1 Tax=Streptomyces sp. NPDC057743 TaxID=3346236 RepID=UPI0036B71801